MKKIGILLLLMTFTLANAQSSKLDEILTLLEQTRGINQNLVNENIDHKKFVNIQDFENYTERKIISIDREKVTYIELFDDKKTGQTTSSIYTGDILRRKNIVSMRANFLEGKKIPIAITKVLLLTKQKDILYLIDINSKQRWIDEASISKK